MAETVVFGSSFTIVRQVLVCRTWKLYKDTGLFTTVLNNTGHVLHKLSQEINYLYPLVTSYDRVLTLLDNTMRKTFCRENAIF